MHTPTLNILLADDDRDDCDLFREALGELEQLSTRLTIVHDGAQLMRHLTETTDQLPNVLFLDINMPRKNGFACLEEIKSHEKLKPLPVIIFSTSYDESNANLLYKSGAQHYICKPADFSELKKVIQNALTLVTEKNISQPRRENFLVVL